MKMMPIYLLLLSALMLSACAHLDNGFMRSAEPLEKGEARGSFGVSSSYSYAPGLNFEPDSLIDLNSRSRDSKLGFQLPAGMDIGLGRNFQVGGQLSLSPGDNLAGKTPIWSITSTSRGYLQYSHPLRDSYWLGFSPGLLFHNEIWEIGPKIPMPGENYYTLKHQSIGGEFPLTITKTNHSIDQKRSNSLTFRYSILKISSEISASKSIFHQTYYYDQPDQHISRYAIIYTHQLENDRTRTFFDVGIEFSDKKGLIVPVIGLKTLFNPPWKKKMKLTPEEA